MKTKSYFVSCFVARLVQLKWWEVKHSGRLSDGSNGGGVSLRDRVMNINELASSTLIFIEPSGGLDFDYIWSCGGLDIHRQQV